MTRETSASQCRDIGLIKVHQNSSVSSKSVINLVKNWAKKKNGLAIYFFLSCLGFLRSGVSPQACAVQSNNLEKSSE